MNKIIDEKKIKFRKRSSTICNKPQFDYNKISKDEFFFSENENKRLKKI